MIFDFGPVSEAIRVTAEYSNAVLVAVLPYFSDYAQKLELPIPHPIAIADVARLRIVPFLDKDRQPLGMSVQLRNGWSLSMTGGYTAAFSSPNSYYLLQNPDETPKFFGTVSMSKADAVKMARRAILRLGIPLEAGFAEQEPRVDGPQVAYDTNKIPRYLVQWCSPEIGIDSSGLRQHDPFPEVEVEVSTDAKRLEMLRLSLRVCQQSLSRHLIKVGIDPPVSPSNVEWPRINPEYARRLVPIVLDAIDDYGRRLHLAIPRPLTTNHVARFQNS